MPTPPRTTAVAMCAGVANLDLYAMGFSVMPFPDRGAGNPISQNRSRTPKSRISSSRGARDEHTG